MRAWCVRGDRLQKRTPTHDQEGQGRGLTMSQKAGFHRALDRLAHAAAAGDRQAQETLDELLTLVKNVSNAVKAGDHAHVDDLLADAVGRALLRSVLG